MKIHSFLLSAIVFGLCSCAPDMSQMASLGMMGTAVGAGTGALVGNLAGVGAQVGALVGAGAGLIGGTTIGYTQDKVKEEHLEAVNNELKANQEMINDRQREIDAQYSRIRDESQTGEPNPALQQDIYDGPTLGQYIR